MATAQFDFVIIGAGPGGEAAAYKARELDASVAVIDRRWFGGSCPHIGCLPSKALLHGAAEHDANPARYSWPRASAHRDYMINRAADAPEPDDSSHVRRLEDAGATVYRGVGRIVARGRVVGRARRASSTRSRPGTSSSRSGRPPGGRRSTVSPTSRSWTNEDATLARELPRSLLVLGGGPTGCELAQVYARFGVPTTVVQSGPRLAPTDHPRNSEVIRTTLETDGVTVRTGVRATRARAGAGRDGAHVVDLDDGSTAEGHVDPRWRSGVTSRWRTSGLEHYGLDTTGRTPFPRDGRLRVANGLYVVGDPAGPELHTHQAHYQGELAVRMALGEDVRPDYRALPRATYTDPEAAFVGRRSTGRWRPGSTPSSSSPTSRRARAATGSRRRSATSRSSSIAAAASSSARRSPVRTRRPPSTSACWPSRRTSRSTSWPRRSTPSRRRRGSSTACSPMRDASSRPRERRQAGLRSALTSARTSP